MVNRDFEEAVESLLGKGYISEVNINGDNTYRLADSFTGDEKLTESEQDVISAIACKDIYDCVGEDYLTVNGKTTLVKIVTKRALILSKMRGEESCGSYIDGFGYALVNGNKFI